MDWAQGQSAMSVTTHILRPRGKEFFLKNFLSRHESVPVGDGARSLPRFAPDASSIDRISGANRQPEHRALVMKPVDGPVMVVRS
jgi:hypothetical protein